MINETVLMQESEKMNLSASDEEVTSRINVLLEENGLNMTEFQHLYNL
jgi:hypothetical protein